jgi:hypothetical protein
VVPDAPTLRVVELPAVIVVDCGCVVIDGCVHDAVVTVTVAALLFALPHEFDTFTQ